MCQSNYLEISRSTLRKNAMAVRDAVQTPIIAVVKCNGYGVTIQEAAAAWQAAGVSVFAVSRPEEAIELRESGFAEDILLLCPVADRQTLKEMLENNIILTVSSFENALFYSANASRELLRVHVAIDTGMGRFGICWKDKQQALAVYSLLGFSFEGIFSHFSCSFEENYKNTQQQLSRFLQMIQALQAEGICVGIRHIANSCAALRFPQTRLDAVRIGSALTGRLPSSTPIQLENVSLFKAQVVECKHFSPGDTTGYGCYCKIRKSVKAAIVALGREDGFGATAKPDKLRLRDLAAYLLRLIQSWRYPPCVMFKGQKLEVLGRVGNQYTLFDTTGTDIRPGDMVEWDGNLMLSSCERRFV